MFSDWSQCTCIYQRLLRTVGLEVLTAVVMKSTTFWDIMPCSPLSVNRHFGGTYRLYLQGRKNRLSLPTAFTLVSCSAYFFDPEDWGDMFLRNVGWRSTDYTALYPRRWYSSHPLWFDRLVTSPYKLISRYSDGLRARQFGLDYWQGKQIFLHSTASTPGLGPTEPPIQWVSGAFPPWVKQPGREADHTLLSSAEVENGGALPPLPIRLHGVVLN
jgi:hypothetical protein